MLLALLILCTAACAFAGVWYGARAHLPSAVIIGLVLSPPSGFLLLWLAALIALLVSNEPPI